MNHTENRSLSRLQNILLSLNNSPNIDTNKTFLLDRSEEEWPLSEQSLENDWELLITHEFINEIFSQIDENETSSESTALLKTRESKALERLKNKYERWHKNILEFEAADVQELYLTTLTQMFDPHTSFLEHQREGKI